MSLKSASAKSIPLGSRQTHTPSPAFYDMPITSYCQLAVVNYCARVSGFGYSNLWHPVDLPVDIAEGRGCSVDVRSGQRELEAFDSLVID